jgi:hypothetical protein
MLQIGLHYMFFTTLAIAVPDTTQLQLPFEVANFWIQHYVLLITPIWLLATRRFVEEGGIEGKTKEGKRERKLIKILQ